MARLIKDLKEEYQFDIDTLRSEYGLVAQKKPYVTIKKLRNPTFKQHTHKVSGYQYIAPFQGEPISLADKCPLIFNISCMIKESFVKEKCIVRFIKLAKDGHVPLQKVMGFGPMFDKERVFLPLQDGIQICVQGRPYHMKAGELWYIPVYISHSIINCDDEDQLFIMFDITRTFCQKFEVVQNEAIVDSDVIKSSNLEDESESDESEEDGYSNLRKQVLINNAFSADRIPVRILKSAIAKNEVKHIEDTKYSCSIQ